METFPEHLNPQYKVNFDDIYIDLVTCRLREEIYHHVLSHTENDYFVLDNFYKKWEIESSNQENITELMISELEANGWNCKTAFGRTALFIYSTEKAPCNCYADNI